MEVLILDTNFEGIMLVDVFESLIWTERYIAAGEFEIYTPMNQELFDAAKIGNYVWMKDSDRLMIIETREITTDVEKGNYLIVSGRSLESILERRIVWEQVVLNGKIDTVVKSLMNRSIIQPEIADRKISNFVYKNSTDPDIAKMTVSKQFTGDNLYDAVVELCNLRSIGFKVTLNDDNQFVFELYNGADRSYDQPDDITANPYVVFSPKFDNVLNSNYLESITSLKNVALVAGEDEAHNRRTRVVGQGAGLSRRELYVDARDIQSETSEGVLPDAEYHALLDERGAEKLAENPKTFAFDGQLEPLGNYQYGRDFFIGDIVQFVNEYGIEAKVRVTEFVRSQDLDGYNVNPTFEVIYEGGD